MLKYFRVKPQPEKIVPDLGSISISLLERDANLPFTIRQLNNLPENVKRRLYRGLLPPALLHLPIPGCKTFSQPWTYISLAVNNMMM